MNIPFFDPKRQYASIKSEINNAIQSVFEKGQFILGENVSKFEQEFANYCGAKFAVGVGSGTEALHLSLVACEVKPEDEVITVPNTAVPTVSAISFANATPILVDIEPETYTINVNKIEEKITKKTKAIIPVHLYGHPVDMEPILGISKKYGIKLIEDACQSHGSLYKNKKTGSIGDIGCFSFYPTKNLGCYGDGGMVITNNEELYNKIKMLRNYGETKRYFHITKGFNSRLDEIQAAILRIKLKWLDKWNTRRREIASMYTQGIKNNKVIAPIEKPYTQHNYHLYVIRTKERDKLQKYLADKGINTLIHYPVPIHLQEAYKDLHIQRGTLPIAEQTSNEILSLPIFPELTPHEINWIIDSINNWK